MKMINFRRDFELKKKKKEKTYIYLIFEIQKKNRIKVLFLKSSKLYSTI